MRHNLLQGLSFSLHLLWICLDDSSILISKAAILIWMDFVEEEPGILFLHERGGSATASARNTHILTYVVRSISIAVQAQTRRAHAHLCYRTELKVVLPYHAAPNCWARTMGTAAPNSSASKANNMSNGVSDGCNATVYPEIILMAQHNALEKLLSTITVWEVISKPGAEANQVLRL